MQVKLSSLLAANADAQVAAQLLGKCVHCGFCTAVCPTYQLLGDELDGPRGRIYLIKQVLEGDAPTASTQLHLDRCLSCRACETACPSGVEYSRLLDIGRDLVEQSVVRPLPERLGRRMLATWLTSWAFAPMLRIAQWARPVLPATLSRRVPRREPHGAWPASAKSERVLLLAGCVQPTMGAGTNAALARVLSAVGIETVVAQRAGCCGAIHQHLGEQAQAKDDARRNIDAWWPHVEAGATAIVASASGCASMVREYAHLLRDDGNYVERAKRITALLRDPVELVAPRIAQLALRPHAPEQRRVVFHPPCSQLHGLKVAGSVETVLTALGAEVLPVPGTAMCCGSAGTYSLLQPAIAASLRDARIALLTTAAPQAILSANVGCISHLAAGTALPVRHWVEWVDERLATSTV